MKLDRAQRLSRFLKANDYDAALFTAPHFQRWIEGFTGDECFLITSGEVGYLIADSRYTELANAECRTAQVLEHRHGHTSEGEAATAAAVKHGWKKICFEPDCITWRQFEQFNASFGTADIEFVPAAPELDDLRSVKDRDEIETIIKACEIADVALEVVMSRIIPGVSELEIKDALDAQMKREGADASAFDTMVLFGARSSQPHATSRRDVVLHAGDFVLIDYGACVNGYRSDTTRTFVCGFANIEQKNAYHAVLTAQLAAIERAVDGARVRDLVRIATSAIERAGCPPFAHSLGHGVGLEIHESPFLRASSDTILQEGMVITIEPGTYSPGWGGIRIEDTVLITSGKPTVLTRFTKELKELPGR